MTMKKRDHIEISDIRGREKSFSLDRHGFEVLLHESKLAYEDFYHPEKVSVYLRELEFLLKSHLNASHVEVFRHGVSVS
jgi:hypothetical protein